MTLLSRLALALSLTFAAAPAFAQKAYIRNDLLADGQRLSWPMRRRFELVGTADGVRVFDDYAHHPTEVRAALTALRAVAQQDRTGHPTIVGARSIVVFQPHLYSRTKTFALDFGNAHQLGTGTTDRGIETGEHGRLADRSSGNSRSASLIIFRGQTTLLAQTLQLDKTLAAGLQQTVFLLLDITEQRPIAALGIKLIHRHCGALQFRFFQLIEPGQIALTDLRTDVGQFRFLLIGFQLLAQGLQGALILIFQLLRLTQSGGS